MIPIFYDYDFGITCIDTMYMHSGLAACYLVTHNDRAAFIDTGTAHSVPYLLEVLKNKNIPIGAVDYVIPTHVHLDHAGGAGLLMKELPNATLIIHPHGAQHMINPEKLIKGATAVYGKEKFKHSFGDILSIDENRVIVAEDMSTLQLSGRTFTFLDTPGHARHHFCVYDEMSNGFFTGDTFGLSYRELDDQKGAFILATTTPVQFDPDVWQHSITKLLEYQPTNMYLTHFGCVNDISSLAEDLRNDIRQHAEIAMQYINKKEAREDKIKVDLTEYLQQRLYARYSKNEVQSYIDILQFDLELNAAGLEVWLSRLEKAA